MEYRIEWPAPMDESDWAMQAIKGWIDVTVVWEGGRREVEVYDPVRLAQSVGELMHHYGYVAVKHLLVVPRVTPENIESAVSELVDKHFFDHT
ncbi:MULTISPECIES: hypothetical protein [unclassified Streptomyces]|uniref:hypothetical protein n=1 Tax=unclassified Streptomyces TaxID=2593676 RepID=UPI0038244625